jgi:hypothetical protein
MKKEPEIYVPFLNCGHKSNEDGTCTHPVNITPECHQFICPIKAAQQGRAGGLAPHARRKKVSSKSKVRVSGASR